MKLLRHPLTLLSLTVATFPLACTAGTPVDAIDGSGSVDGGLAVDGNRPANDGGSTDGLTVDQGNAPGVCGNAALETQEACDDGNLTAGDGCSEKCFVEEGFVCPKEGEACRPYAKCGDGKLVFPEQCDDDGVEAGDGCSPLCKLEVGFKCDGEPSTCVPTVCGDGNLEGAETCEAADGMPFDGCSLTCQAEPSCTGDGCTSSCGDGLVIGSEQCDDGNATPNDGCSADCQIEEGYECPPTPACEGENCFLELPIIYRDFQGTHPDFYPPEDKTCTSATAGLAANRLGDDGKPVLAGSSPCIESADSFAEWYGAKPGPSATLVDHIKLYPNGQGGFVNRYGENGEAWPRVATEQQTATVRCTEAGCCAGEDPWNCCEANETTCRACTYNASSGCEQTIDELDGNPLFFPLDGNPDALPAGGGAAKIPSEIYGAVGWPWENPACADGGVCTTPEHNFFFTTEIAYWFKYEEGATANLTFVGDDDVWVYLNRRLVLDLGGIHVPLSGSLSLTADGNVTLRTAQPDDANAPTAMPQPAGDTQLSLTTTTAAELGLEPGGVYEIKMFHAERKPEGSSFQLTLSGFNAARSQCTAICGDGILGAGEQCDDGMNNAKQGEPIPHNGCGFNCELGAYCGDGIVQSESGEECDDGDPNAPNDCSGCRRITVK